MSFDAPIDMKKFCDGKLTPEQEARVREVAVRLQIREDDAVWQLLEAMEYQRIFYEKLPKQIEDTTGNLLKSVKDTAEAQVAQSKAELTKEVVEQARTLAVKLCWSKLLPFILGGIIAILIFGAMMLWAGYCVGLGKPVAFEKLFYMPGGALISGIAFLLTCAFTYIAAQKYADEESFWLPLGGALISALGMGWVLTMSY